MNNNTRMYKTLSSSEIAKLGIKIDRNYYYITENDIKEIKEQKFDNTSHEKIYQLIDEDYEWNPKIHSLIMDISVSLKDCSSIFGTNGSCYEDSIVGVGLTWKTDKSKIKRCIKICEITKDSKDITVPVNSIKLDDVSSNITFKVFFYIVSPGKTNGIKYFGNEQGIILHEQVMWTIIINGTGSIFPIIEIEDEGPLWTYMCDIDDICEDYFDNEHIEIRINTKHPAYEFIHPKSQTYNVYFLNELMSNAIATIIMDIRSKQSNGKIDLDEDFESGSILQAIKYFNDKLNFDINGSYDNLLKTVKEYFDKEC